MHTHFAWIPRNEEDYTNPSLLKTTDDAKRFLELLFGNKLSYIDDLDSSLQNLVDSKPSNVRVSKISQYHHKNGKVVLAGDAAHTMSSAMGLVSILSSCLQNFMM